MLKHELTITTVGDMLPSNASENSYIKLRLRRLGQGDTEIQTMVEFMTAKQKQQKAKERMGNSDTSSKTDSKSEPNDS